MAVGRPILRKVVNFSTGSPYAALGREELDGALITLVEIIEDSSSSVSVESRLGDRAGRTDHRPGVTPHITWPWVRPIAQDRGATVDAAAAELAAEGGADAAGR